MKNNALILFLRLSRPMFLIGGIGQFLLGAGIARYLGYTIDPAPFFLGLTWILAMQLTTHYLNEYFDSPIDQNNPNRTPFSGGSGVLGEGEGQLNRNVGIVAAGTGMTVVAFLTIALTQNGVMDPGLGLVMALIFLGGFFYSTPPIRLTHSGYGELTTSILVGNLVPAFSFLLFSDQLHRLVIMSTLPLTFMIFSLLLVVEFPDYATDLKFGKRNLIVRIGWENGMGLHNTFVLLAFVILGLGGVFGIPAPIVLPAFLSLPLGILQVVTMRRIADGAKPNWIMLSMNAVATIGLTIYLLGYAFWTR